ARPGTRLSVRRWARRSPSSHAITSPANSSKSSRVPSTRHCRGSCRRSRRIRTLSVNGRCDVAATREARVTWNGDLMSGNGVVSAKVTFDKVGDNWTVVASALDVTGEVPGADAAKFREAATGAKDNCPISRALKGNVNLSVSATLQS